MAGLSDNSPGQIGASARRALAVSAGLSVWLGRPAIMPFNKRLHEVTFRSTFHVHPNVMGPHPHRMRTGVAGNHGLFRGRAVESAGYLVGGTEDAECVYGAGDEPGNGTGLGSAQDVGELGEPFILVDGGALAGGEAAGGEAEDGVGHVVEAVSYLLAGHVAECGHAEADEETDPGPEVAGHAGLPWGLGRVRTSAGGRYWSLRAASWRRAAVTATPVMV
jgi:hypothetical protein